MINALMVVLLLCGAEALRASSPAPALPDPKPADTLSAPTPVAATSAATQVDDAAPASEPSAGGTATDDGTADGIGAARTTPVADATAPAPAADSALSTPDAGFGPAPRSDEGTALAAYLAGLAEGMLTRGDIAGIVVAVVRRDRTLLVGGYGRASVEPERAADGERSLFRIGSVSKTFTYTAAMQLVERGRIGLDDPVNLHLPASLKLPDAGYAEPVRVRHLLTHTAGFEDSALGHLFVRDPARVASLMAYLGAHRPARVRAPGTVAVYSNYGVGLLGALVANVSGLPFEDYVEQNLTGPLGMARTSFREPKLPSADPRRLADALAADLATGYERSGGAFKPGVFEHIAQIGPAGAASSTAADMARWMRVQLGDGELDGVRILAPETARRMREILFRNAGDSGVGALAHGFLATRMGPYYAYGHGGATLYFHSALLMLPEADLGVFVSANTGNARAAVLEIARLIIARLAPEAASLPAAQPADASALSRYAGTYRSNRRNYTRAEKWVLAFNTDAVVAPAPDGSLRLAVAGETQRLVPVAPNVFVDPESGMRAEFLTDASGAVTGYVAGFGISVHEKLRRWETHGALGVALALALLVALVRLARAFRREKRNPPPRPGLGAVKALSVLSALAWLGFGALAVWAAVELTADRSAVMFSYPSREFVWALWAASAVAMLAVLELLSLLPVWRGEWRAWPKLRYTLATLAIGAAVALMAYWNLIGVRP